MEPKVIPIKRIGLFVLCAVLSLSGCLYRRHRVAVWESFLADLPEQIYMCPEANPFRLSRVAVFRFSEPAYAPGTGKAAAEAMFDGLLKDEVFSFISKETEKDYSDNANCLDLAHLKGYDLIITGEVLYYFDGSMALPSCVNERISVIDVPTRRILWSASSFSKADPSFSRYYFLSSTEGSPARPASELMESNAEKFCNMLLRHSSHQTETGVGNLGSES